MFSNINGANIFFETAGSGDPIVFIHAGVADSRQWNNEFAHFATDHFVVRYDMRGFGQSPPVAGEFTHLEDLAGLIQHLSISDPITLVGCSMGGSTAIDLALSSPDLVRALVLVASGPNKLQLDVPVPPKFKLAAEADKAGDLQRVAEIELEIWFDGDRDPNSVDQTMRALAYDMNWQALQHDALELGTQKANLESKACDRLDELQMPVLSISGAQDIPFMLAASEYMSERISDFRQLTIEHAAHLPNLDAPDQFQKAVEDFLQSL